MRRLINLILILGVYPLIAQPNVDLENYKEKFPGSYSIFTSYHKNFLIDFEGDELDIEASYNEEIFYMNEYRAKFAEGSLVYSGFDEILEYEAAAYIPSGNKYKKKRIKEFKEKDLMDGAIFHDDYKQISCSYPQLMVGAKSSFSYKRKIKEPRLFGTFYFSHGDAIESGGCEVKIHKDIELEYKLFNTEGFDIEFQKKQTGNYIIYNWTIDDFEKIDIDDDSQSYQHILPHILFRIKGYTKDSKKISVLEDLNDLHDWYRSFIDQIGSTDETVLQPIVDSLTLGIDNEPEKVRKLFYWVQDHIKYIAIEDQMKGFIPESASNVCSSRYGDCKGKSNILIEMMRLAGIKGYYTWVGTRKLPYSYLDFPSPMNDNHMIVTYIHDGNYYFLDGTADFLDFESPSDFIQGKEALISKSKEEYEIRKVPIVESEINRYNSLINLFVDGERLEGDATIQIEGYYKSMYYSYALRNAQESDLKERVEYMFELGNNKFHLRDFSIKGLNERDEPLILEYTFYIDNYLNRHEDEYFLNMNLTKIYIDQKLEDDREHALKEDFAGIYTSRTVLHLPENGEIEYIPPSHKFENDLFNYDLSYSYQEDSNKFILDRRYENKHIVLENAYFGEWNKMIKNLKQAYNETILFKTK